jgi:flagellar hook-basal body complex protein FliE
MSIETIGGFKNILNSYNSADWARSAKIDVGSELKFTEVPNGGKTNLENQPTFADVLANSVTKVNDLQKEANRSIEALATGKTQNIHETLLAVEKADIAFRTMNQVRMKVIDAYREVMRMQI